MPIERPDWTETPSGAADPAFDRDDGGPGKVTHHDDPSSAPQGHVLLKDGRIQRQDWGESSSTEPLDQETDDATARADLADKAPAKRPDWPLEEAEPVDVTSNELDPVQQAEIENFMDADLIDEWRQDDGDADAKLDQAQSLALVMTDDLDDVETAVMERSFDALDNHVQQSVIRELAMTETEAEPASEEMLAEFREGDPGMFEFWGEHSAKNLGIVLARIDRLSENMSDDAKRQFTAWYDHLSVEQQHGIMRALVR